ncbi:hypothetical protein [Pseudomonas sp. H9]|uniref:hypothetical protein n=1 Tax=Pseudomonas sp. H9 TaxID=483968 RepID=UPI001057E83E|nr:hypothetical protein [Pseudomonas sp. H9]TDF79998.1 hypothetical protein E1573_21010 [Pseudomonas sp. H9]
MKKGAMVPVLAGAGKLFMTFKTALAGECGERLRPEVAPFCPEVVQKVLPLEGFGAPKHL